MSPSYRHIFVFFCFFLFMYLNIETFDAANRDIANAELNDPNYQRKIVHLIRHGQAEHNVDKNYDILDPALTQIGQQQAKDLQKQFEAIDVELIVVSPLRRTVQTALRVFESDKFKDTPIVANEWCRESYGLVICDKRRNLSDIKNDFEYRVDFSSIDTDEDTWWETNKEPEEHLIMRAKTFYHFLRTQSATKIAVVSHHGFLRALSRLLREKLNSNADAYSNDEFENCEARIVFV